MGNLMSGERYRGLLISDFMLDNLTSLFSNDREAPLVEASAAPFGQVLPLLLDQHHPSWKGRTYEFAVVWTRPQAVVEGYRVLLDHKPGDIEQLLAQVDEYSSALARITQKVRFAFVPTWVMPPYHRGLGMLEMKPRFGLASALMRMNIRLAENLDTESNIFVLDAHRWIAQAGSRAFNPKLWYMAKIPFGNEVFVEAVKDIKAAISGIAGNARKLVIVDLDDTLWGGIVGDDGWENLRLGGHDYIGEAYIDFQLALKALSNRGVLLGIASKNDESIALEAIDKHPEMILRRDDFADWKINWNDKVQNIVEMVDELNLGLQSVVFLDDNPVERSWVRESLPEVLVLELPEDKMLYSSTLLSLRCFDTPSLSSEDLGRTRMYTTERKRKDLEKSTRSIDEWLRSLEIRVSIETLNESNLKRAAQLLNKTNQMNLSTRRMTEKELAEWAGQRNRRLWLLRVSDKFGDSGMTGMVSLQLEDHEGRIVDFILSCRVMGRKVEEAMISRVYKHARSAGLEQIYADYIPTRQNRPCFNFWSRSGFEYDKEANRFSWPMDKEYPHPDSIQIVGEE